MYFYCEECETNTFIESKEDANIKIEQTKTSLRIYFRCSDCKRWFLIVEKDSVEEEKLPI